MIREMREKDVPDVTRLANRIMPFAWSVAVFHSCLRSNYKSFVLEKEARIVGFIILLLMPSELHLMNIGVDHAFQRQGLAKELLKDALQMSVGDTVLTDSAQVSCGENCIATSELLLEVRRSNKAAITFYRSVGFSQFAIRKNYYKTKWGNEDAVLMRLPLFQAR